MLQLTFKQTNSEQMVRAAATVLFAALSRQRVTTVSIADLAERPQYGFTASAATEPVGPKFVRITDLQDGKIDWDSVPFCECDEPDKYALRENDILFARTGATTGKTHLVLTSEAAVFASYLIRLRPKRAVEAGYLHAFFQSDNYWSQISEEKKGSAQPNVNGEKLAAIKIPSVTLEVQRAIAEFLRCVRLRQDGDAIELPELPLPLAEQRRVVARLEELADQIYKARTLRNQAAEEAEALIAGYAAAAFERLARQHKPLPFASLSPHVTSGPRNWGKHYDQFGVRFYRAQDIGVGGVVVDDSKVFVLPPPGDQGRSAILHAGDLMLVITGATVGRVAPFREGMEPGFVSQHVAICRLPRNVVNSEFAIWGLRSPFGQEQLLVQRYVKGSQA